MRVPGMSGRSSGDSLSCGARDRPANPKLVRVPTSWTMSCVSAVGGWVIANTDVGEQWRHGSWCEDAIRAPAVPGSASADPWG